MCTPWLCTLYTIMHAVCCKVTHFHGQIPENSDVIMNITVQHQIFNELWLCNLVFSVWIRGKSHRHWMSALVSEWEETELVGGFSDMTWFLQQQTGVQSNSAEKKQSTLFLLRLYNCKLYSSGTFKHMESSSSSASTPVTSWKSATARFFLPRLLNSHEIQKPVFPPEKCI